MPQASAAFGKASAAKETVAVAPSIIAQARVVKYRDARISDIHFTFVRIILVYELRKHGLKLTLSFSFDHSLERLGGKFCHVTADLGGAPHMEV